MDIIELFINDDDETGLDGVALVNHPAHEAQFEYFSKHNTECGDNCSHYVLSDDKIAVAMEMFGSFGEPQGHLEKEGFKIVKIKPVGRQDFNILADPNAPSSQDTNEVKFRYKYVGPVDSKNRDFCAQMMKANRVFRIEDIIEMSKRSVNNVGPDGYDIFTWRGSYNCRHKWVQLMYSNDERIINKAYIRKGLLDEDEMPAPDTRTTLTIEAGNTPPRGEVFSSDRMDFSVTDQEKRILVGPAMIPDLEIPRMNDITGEIYYVFFKEESIRKIQQKFMEQKLLDKTNIEHTSKFLKGVDVIESWMVDNPEKDKQQVFNMNYPKGTWMISVKVKDDEVWKQVKEGKLRGFSVQGIFAERKAFKKHDILDKIKEIVKKIK